MRETVVLYEQVQHSYSCDEEKFFTKFRNEIAAKKIFASAVKIGLPHSTFVMVKKNPKIFFVCSDML
jgi:hypothetical protein